MFLDFDNTFCHCRLAHQWEYLYPIPHNRESHANKYAYFVVIFIIDK